VGRAAQGIQERARNRDPARRRDARELREGDARDAQMLESRAFDAREIANVLGVPPHKLGDPSRTAYNSLESENQGYRDDTLGPWFAAWEQECDAKLLTEAEKEAETHCAQVRPAAVRGRTAGATGAILLDDVPTSARCVNDDPRAVQLESDSRTGRARCTAFP
jgi:hypothetical protein